MNFGSDQEAVAIKHFRKLIRPWRAEFTEDNWPSTANHLHELLHRAMIAEGADPAWIEWLAHEDWHGDCFSPPAVNTGGKDG